MKAYGKNVTMKQALLILLLLLAQALAPAARAEGTQHAAAPRAEDPKAVDVENAADDADAEAEDAAGQAERRVATTPDVVVELSLQSGDVVVQGWERKEVRAYSPEAGRIDLRHSEAVAGQPSAAGTPVGRVAVLVGVPGDERVEPGEYGSGSVELNVPRGATVILHIQSGDVDVSDVAEARIDSASGDVNVRRVSRATDVNCFSGNVILDDAQGPVRLRSLSGEVSATRARPLSPRDDVQVSTTSGDITLEAVTHARVVAKTVSGGVSFEGPLAAAGTYDLRTTNGDVTLMLPADASFKINARVVTGGEIITDFPVKGATLQPAPKPETQTRLTGTVAGGDADINLSSFNGTVYLRKM
ncbi:MAG TPA: DUF4097 family beta strand repeat-containing protein [Pyrinomonadaceae bacterium]|nr:DUF4097 family beta strand repeat-containing protein [Pyrinomonadaceae bacterium]